MGEEQAAHARPYMLETPEGAAAKLVGWKDISRALDVSEDAAFRASRRAIDPLRVRYDAFGRPWIKRSRLDAWVEDNDRSARQYDVERAHEREKRAAAEAGQSGAVAKKTAKHGRIERPVAGMRR